MAQFTNQASLSYNGITINSNTVTGEITQALTAWKRSILDSYTLGDVLTYVVNIQNTGNVDYTGLTVTDDLGETPFGTTTVTPLTYTGDPIFYTVNDVIQAAPAVASNNPLTISGINVPAGGSAEIIYRARVNNFAEPGADGSIENTATVNGGGLTEAVTASDTVDANTAPLLSILKELNPTTVPENGQITYTFTIENRGTTEVTAAESPIVTDEFDPALDAPITVTIDGAVVTEAGNYSYNAATGSFATLPGAFSVPAAAFTQDTATGEWSITPGTTVITVAGTI